MYRDKKGEEDINVRDISSLERTSFIQLNYIGFSPLLIFARDFSAT